MGYDTTALLFIDRDTATLSVVQTDDGSVVKVLSRTLHGGDAMAVLTEMAAAVDAQDSPPQGMFVVGSGVDVSAVKAHLANLVALPVNAPDEPELALARGAALASAHAPTLEASTVGLAYSQDPDGTTAGSIYPGLAGAATQLAPVGGADQLVEADLVADLESIDEGRKPFLLVGSALTSIFVVGVVALVVSLAVSIRPTVDQRPSPGQSAIVPSTQAPRRPAGARGSAGRATARAAATSRGDHQSARAGRARNPAGSTGATDGVCRAARGPGAPGTRSRTGTGRAAPGCPHTGARAATDLQPAGLPAAGGAAAADRRVAEAETTADLASAVESVAATAAAGRRTGGSAVAAPAATPGSADPAATVVAAVGLRWLRRFGFGGLGLRLRWLAW